jgi:hypothetical protein
MQIPGFSIMLNTKKRSCKVRLAAFSYGHGSDRFAAEL